MPLRPTVQAAIALLVTAACASGPGPRFDVNTELVLNEPRQLQLGEETHTFTVLQQSADRAMIEIRSEPRVWMFVLNVALAVDVNDEAGPDLVVEVTRIEGDAVTIRVTAYSDASGSSDVAPTETDPWDTPSAAAPEGKLLHTLTIADDREGPTALYDMAPQKNACDLKDPTLFDAYVKDTGGKTRVIHTLAGSRGFPYFEIATEEHRSRYADCTDQWGHGPTTTTELMLGEKRGVDLDGNGSIDVDAFLQQVRFTNHTPTATLLMYAR